MVIPNAASLMVPMTMGASHGGPAGGFFPLAPLFGLLAMAAVFGTVGYLLVRGFRRTEGQFRDSTDSATDVLRERYARGEIDDEEFRTRMDHLER